MAVVESDTDTVDDSSPDHYQPVRSHHCGGVAAENLQETVNVAQHVGNSGGMAQCSLNSGVVTQYSVNSGGVAQHTAAHRGVMAGQQFHPSLSDDELDKLFASVEVCMLLVVLHCTVVTNGIQGCLQSTWVLSCSLFLQCIKKVDFSTGWYLSLTNIFSIKPMAYDPHECIVFSSTKNVFVCT